MLIWCFCCWCFAPVVANASPDAYAPALAIYDVAHTAYASDDVAPAALACVPAVVPYAPDFVAYAPAARAAEDYNAVLATLSSIE